MNEHPVGVSITILLGLGLLLSPYLLAGALGLLLITGLPNVPWPFRPAVPEPLLQVPCLSLLSSFLVLLKLLLFNPNSCIILDPLPAGRRSRLTTNHRAAEHALAFPPGSPITSAPGTALLHCYLHSLNYSYCSLVLVLVCQFGLTLTLTCLG